MCSVRVHVLVDAVSTREEKRYQNFREINEDQPHTLLSADNHAISIIV
jgi:hypothetical protein